MIQRGTPPVVTHGRFIVEPAAGTGAPMLVGFHGYAESDEIQFERMRAIPGVRAWHVVSVQGLHRFYRGRGADRMVVASWMTRQDRELAIADNLQYVKGAVDSIARDLGAAGPVVFAGFSQGVAMAFRAAALIGLRVGGVIAAGGDVPPDIDTASLRRVGRALVARGSADTQYPREQWTRDVERLRAAGVEATPFEFEGGHAWTQDLSGAAAAFLERRRVRP